ncbi:MAG: FAD-dependent monooxygenase, partial [Burkholderiales bacterium]
MHANYFRLKAFLRQAAIVATAAIVVTVAMMPDQGETSMHIDVIGGGPAGLYFAILAKKSFPDAVIDVVERNRPDDTFGFGIVLSDETLNNLRQADEPSYREIADNFAYWDDIYVQFRGHTLKSSGHGFSGLKRIVLLNILQRRAQQLGIRVRYETEDPGIEAHLDADLVVAADGINSAVRERWVDHFEPEVDLRPNRFVWLGANMNLPGFFYSFREDAHGHVWNMHAYQYTPGECTLVIETTNEAWEQSGLTVPGEAQTAAMVETIFADDLRGARVLTNRSHWRQFPTIKCRTWYRVLPRPDGGKTGVVLIGDAAHTAHWSIGSGTKLAIEDAIALHDSLLERLRAGDDVEGALAAYEQARYDEASRIQHSANVSLVWFENLARFWNMEPIQFNTSLLTRSKQITYENLQLRDAPLVYEITRWWNRRVAGE